MPLDPQVADQLARMAGQPAMDTLSVADARAGNEGRVRPAGPAVGSVSEHLVPGPGGELRLRCYLPQGGGPPGDGPHPVAMFFHGGGFVLCSLDTHDGICRHLCHLAGCAVVSVDYRRAPEAPFPAATDDCLAATRWVAAHPAAFGVDPSRMVLAGDSAGGNLATVTALRIRDEGGPSLCGQLLVYPLTGPREPPPPSMIANGERYGLTRGAVRWFWNHYLSGTAGADHPHAVPACAADLAGLPPALVVTAEFDPLCDEGEAYAARLKAAGVETEVSRVPGMIHGFLGSTGSLQLADATMASVARWLAARLAVQDVPSMAAAGG